MNRILSMGAVALALGFASPVAAETPSWFTNWLAGFDSVEELQAQRWPGPASDISSEQMAAMIEIRTFELSNGFESPSWFTNWLAGFDSVEELQAQRWPGPASDISSEQMAVMIQFRIDQLSS